MARTLQIERSYKKGGKNGGIMFIDPFSCCVIARRASARRGNPLRFNREGSRQASEDCFVALGSLLAMTQNNTLQSLPTLKYTSTQPSA